MERERDFSKVTQHAFGDMGSLWSLSAQAESLAFALNPFFVVWVVELG